MFVWRNDAKPRWINIGNVHRRQDVNLCEPYQCISSNSIMTPTILDTNKNEGFCHDRMSMLRIPVWEPTIFFTMPECLCLAYLCAHNLGAHHCFHHAHNLCHNHPVCNLQETKCIVSRGKLEHGGKMEHRVFMKKFDMCGSVVMFARFSSRASVTWHKIKFIDDHILDTTQNPISPYLIILCIHSYAFRGRLLWQCKLRNHRELL